MRVTGAYLFGDSGSVKYSRLQRAQFIIDFLQFALRLTGRHPPRTSLVRQRIVAAQQAADHDRMHAASVKAHKTDATAIKAPGGRLVVIDQFHSLEFGRPAKRARRKSGSQQLEWIITGTELSPYFTHEMDNMVVKLDIPVANDGNFITGPAQVITRQIHQHHMLRVLLFIGQQFVGELTVGLIITRTPEGSCDRVNDRLTVLQDDLRFGGRAHQLIIPIVIKEQIGGWIDIAQRPIDIEFITGKNLPETAAPADLENIPAQTTLYSPGYHLRVGLIGEIRRFLAHRLKGIDGHIFTADQRLHYRQFAFQTGDHILADIQFVPEMIDRDHILIQPVTHKRYRRLSALLL